MTLTRFESTGSDSGLAARLVIEGSPYVFVSDASLVAAAPTESDGRIRINSLVLSGIQIEEEAILSEGRIESAGMSIEILDRHPDDLATRALAMTPDGVRYLTADLSAVATTIDLDSTAGISNGSFIHLGTECVKVGTVASAVQLTGCTRAQFETTAQAHYAGDSDTFGPQEVHISRPATLGGRRAFLYLFGAGDPLSGSGTLRWRGIVTIDPSLGIDGATWTLQIDPLTSLFDANLGADLGPPAVPRGVYMPDAQPLRIFIGSFPGSTREIAFSGFFETNQDLVDEINTWLAAEIDGTLEIDEIRAVIRDTGEWDFDVTLSGTPADEYVVSAFSPCDGMVTDWMSADGSTVESFNRLADPTASATYRVVRNADAPEGGGRVPRGVLGRPAAVGYADRLTEEARENLSGASNRLIYLGGSVVPALVTGAEVQWADGETTQHDLDFDASDRWIELTPAPFKVFTPASLPEIKLKRRYASGGLKDFRDGLVNNSPTFANLGLMPWIHAGDLTSWTEAEDAERDIPFAAQRVFVAYESVKLADLLEAEFRLRALCPRFTVDGQIGLTRITLPSQTAVAEHTLTEAEIPWSDSETPTWQRHSEGWVNTCIYKLGYNAATEEHEGRTYVVRNVQGLANRKQSRELEIAPLSEPRTREDVAGLTYDQLVRLAQPILSVLGSGYYTIDVPVIWKHFGALVGDVVSLTCSTIPNVATGTRGVTDLRCLVVGRTWELGSGRGTLRLLASMQRIYGYAPSLTITNQTDLGGNRWELQLSFNEPTNQITMWDPTNLIGSHFALSDRIRAIAWDDGAAPSKQVGDVDVIDEGLVRMEVVFDGVWVPDGTANVLELESADAVTSASRLGSYAVLAEDDGTISWSGGDERGGGFAP